MEALFKEVTSYVALGIEAAAVLVIAYGGLEAIARLVKNIVQREKGMVDRKETWRGFAAWLLLGLEFTLAADILRTAIAPTWNDIGQLASIAVIRTFLNYFLEKDMRESGKEPPDRTIKAAA